MVFNESNLDQLYHSAVAAFPNTAFRQFATNTIKIAKMDWIPFLGMKTLFIKSVAQNEGKEYETIILFKNMSYLTEEVGNSVTITASDGFDYTFKPINESQDVLVKCNCPDFKYRFAFYNHQEHSLYGRKPAPYRSKGMRGPANPTQSEGLCKHLIKTGKALNVAGIFG